MGRFIPGPLPVHYRSVIGSLSVRYRCVPGALPVHYRSVIGSLSVCSRCVPGSFLFRSRFVIGVFPVRYRCVPSAFPVRSRSIRGPFAVHSRFIRGSFAVPATERVTGPTVFLCAVSASVKMRLKTRMWDLRLAKHTLGFATFCLLRKVLGKSSRLLFSPVFVGLLGASHLFIDLQNA